MRRVAANLTPLLACPAFLLWHLLGAVLCLPAFLYGWQAAGSGSAIYVAVFVVPLWSAFVLTSLQRDLLIRPFSFCLPGHRSVQRRTTLLVGSVASLVVCLPLLSYRELVGLDLLWATWSVFCFGLSIYLVVVGFLFVVGNVANFVGPLVVPAALMIEFPALRDPVRDAALFAPVANTLVLAALALYAWRRLGSVELARRSQGERFLSLQMSWRRTAVEEFGERGRRESLSRRTWALRDRVLRAFFERIGRRPALSLRRHLAAEQYEVVGRLAPLSPWSAPLVLAVALLLLVVTGYAPLWEAQPELPAANLVYAGVCVLAMYLPVPVFSTLLLPAGRRERFWTSLALAACAGLLVLGASMLAHLVFQGLAAAAPPFTLGEHELIFRPADLVIALVPLVYLPLTLLLKITCKKWLMVPESLLLLVTILIVLRGGAAMRDMGPAGIVLMLGIPWALFVGVLHNTSLRRDGC